MMQSALSPPVSVFLYIFWKGERSTTAPVGTVGRSGVKGQQAGANAPSAPLRGLIVRRSQLRCADRPADVLCQVSEQGRYRRCRLPVRETEAVAWREERISFRFAAEGQHLYPQPGHLHLQVIPRFPWLQFLDRCRSFVQYQT